MSAKKLTLLIVLATLLPMLLGLNTAMAAPTEKVDICHHDKDAGTWELINVSGNSVDKHFSNHDDAYPGEATSNSGTVLDANCLPECPDCFESNGTPGCENGNCEAVVCGIDPFCCEVTWDSICAGEAEELCNGLICNPPAPAFCGDDWMCGDELVLCGSGGLDDICICDQDVEGNFFCWGNFFCEDSIACDSNADCSAGEACVTSCCGEEGAGTCAPACPDPNVAPSSNAPVSSEPTAAGPRSR